MKKIKKLLGLVWLLIGPLIIFVLLKGAFDNIDPDGGSDINKPVPWIIIISIFTPIAVGLMLFGWYVWKGEFEDKNPVPDITV